VGEVDVHLAEFGRRPDVDERHRLTAAAKIGEGRGGYRGNHGKVLRDFREQGLELERSRNVDR
jgi:hypothetical protein